jgi:hypothetical protein
MNADFMAAMDELVSAYPGSKFEGRHFKRYWAILQKYPIEDLRAGIAEAIRHHVNFVPNAGQVHACVLAVRRRGHEEREQQLEVWDGDMDRLRRLYPDTDFAERELPEGHRATALAIEWRREDRERTGGRPGNTPTPIAKARLERLFAMMDDAGFGDVPF